MTSDQEVELKRLYGQYLNKSSSLPSEKQIRMDTQNNELLKMRQPLHIKLWIHNRKKKLQN